MTKRSLCEQLRGVDNSRRIEWSHEREAICVEEAFCSEVNACVA